MTTPQRLLVFRFSSLGDVAMTVPVLKCLLHQYPGLQITMVSTEFVRPLFEDMEGVRFFAADLKGKHKGVPGLFKLYRELRSSHSFHGIADLHNVLRTKILKAFFAFSPLPVASIDKGRKEKKELTRQHHKKLRPLKSTFQRYAEVFAALGFPLELVTENGWKQKGGTVLPGVQPEPQYSVGIAPFALHKEKTYPAGKMENLLHLLAGHGRIRVFLFGGERDARALEDWQERFPNVQSMAGKMSFEKELQFLSRLNLMVSMDSANMHLASLYGVPVISVWGGTHPYLGFYGWGQDPGNAVQVDLECRPSSVFGNKPCPRGDFACMNMISPIVIYEKVLQNLELL